MSAIIVDRLEYFREHTLIVGSLILNLEAGVATVTCSEGNFQDDILEDVIETKIGEGRDPITKNLHILLVLTKGTTIEEPINSPIIYPKGGAMMEVTLDNE